MIPTPDTSKAMAAVERLGRDAITEGYYQSAAADVVQQAIAAACDAHALTVLRGACCLCRRERSIHEAMSDDGDPPFADLCGTCQAVAWLEARRP